MRIVSLPEFRKMPEGTIFCKYHPQVFGSLQVFGGAPGGEDFIAAELVGEVRCESSNEMHDILSKAEATGESFGLEVDSYSRDGMYESAQLFAIYETADIVQLMEALTESAIKAYKAK